MGIASTNLNDFVKVETNSSINNNLNLQLLIYYINIGTQNNPQFKIIKTYINSLTISNSGQPTLFI